ncbi:hypothetical protein [Ornithinimicrobium tianjinense]|uniref:Enoyl reductase n=1 Tax=Ornithinimicrobium tianjinense TaxID=1195761 RepID=A0A917BQT4_9MICO|nr:hypothetical protein [Ornithinimicrobium tianjinense]GGF54104.1 hypothetical protein GCM10011366_22430 [Ornithinimicrobium tianjinense]
MTVSTRRARRLGGIAAALGLTVALAAPASAGLGDPPSRPGEGITWGDGGQVKIKSMHTGNGTCSFIASPNSLGGICVTANGVDGPSITEVLAGDPLPSCWDEKLTDQELEDTNLQHGDGTSWYWHRCLRGIDPETLEIEPGGINFGIGIWPFADDDPDLVFLTPNQQAFVDRFVSRGNVPEPVLLASPNPVPLVNQDVAFYNYGDDQIQVDMSVPGVAMRGKITQMIVYPQGRPGPAVTCPGAGVQAQEGDTPRSLREACWYAYKESSLGRDGDYYDAEIHVKWQVDVLLDGRWQPFHSFTKGAPAMIPVNEVQALVQP